MPKIDMRDYWKFLYLLCFLLPFGLKAQPCTVGGSVRLIGETGLPGGISVQLLDADARALVRFTLSDSTGTFRLEAPTAKRIYTLRAAFIGYRDSLLRIDCDSTLRHEVSIALRPLVEQLDEFTVLEKLQLFRIQGDTTIVDVQQLATGYEESLTELLERIPGLTVSGDRLSYRGKVLEDVTVEGRSVSGGRHTTVTDLLRPETVADVRLIERYQEDLARVSDNDTEETRIGLDIRLTDEARNRWQFLLEAGGGLPGRDRIRLEALRSEQRTAQRAAIETHNTDKKRSGDNLEQLMRQSRERNRQRSYARLSDSVDPPLSGSVSPQTLRRTRYHEATYHWDQGIQGKERWKGAFEASRFQGNGERRQTFLSFDTPEDSLRQLWEGSASETFLRFDPEYRFASDSLRLTVRLPVDYNATLRRATVRRSAGDDSWNLNESERNTDTRLAPVIEGDWQFNSRLRLSVYSQTVFRTTGRKYTLGGEELATSLTWLTAPPSAEEVSQTSDYRDTRLHHSVELRYRPTKQWTFEGQLIRADRNERLLLSTDQIGAVDFSGDRRSTFSRSAIALRTRFDNKKWRWLIGGVAESVRLRSEGIQDRRSALVPYATLVRKLRGSWMLHSSYRAYRERPGLWYQHGLQQLFGPVQIETADVSPDRIHQVETFQLGFSRFNRVSLRGGIATFSAIYELPGFRFRTLQSNQNGIQQIQYYSVKAEETYGFTGTYSYGVSGMNILVRSNFQRGKIAFDAGTLDERRWYSSVSVSYLASKIFHGKTVFNHSRYRQHAADFSSTISTYSIANSFKLEHQRWKLLTTHRLQGALGQPAHFVNIELTKQWANSDWTATLRADQLLRTATGQPEVTATVNGYIYTESIYRPTELLILLKWRFGG